MDVLEEMIHVGEEIAQQGEGFFSTLEALIKALEHHIKEEEDEIFETAELFFTTPQLKQMGEEFIQEVAINPASIRLKKEKAAGEIKLTNKTKNR